MQCVRNRSFGAEAATIDWSILGHSSYSKVWQRPNDNITTPGWNEKTKDLGYPGEQFRIVLLTKYSAYDASVLRSINACRTLTSSNFATCPV